VGQSSWLGFEAEIFMLESVGLMTSSLYGIEDHNVVIHQREALLSFANVLIQRLQAVLQHINAAHRTQYNGYVNDIGNEIAHLIGCFSSLSKGSHLIYVIVYAHPTPTTSYSISLSILTIFLGHCYLRYSNSPNHVDSKQVFDLVSATIAQVLSPQSQILTVPIVRLKSIMYLHRALETTGQDALDTLGCSHIVM
jgi:hypothetical protein